MKPNSMLNNSHLFTLCQANNVNFFFKEARKAQHSFWYTLCLLRFIVKVWNVNQSVESCIWISNYENGHKTCCPSTGNSLHLSSLSTRSLSVKIRVAALKMSLFLHSISIFFFLNYLALQYTCIYISYVMTHFFTSILQWKRISD